MGGDDFQKRGSGLGLRDAISKSRDNHKKAAEKRALELFMEMDIIEKVTSAIDEGNSSVWIPFPSLVQNRSPDNRYSGEVLWSDVVKSFSSMIEEEVESLEIKLGPFGGCCISPDKSGSGCKNCTNRHRRSTGEGYNSVVLVF
jgi:hypothetical protein